MGSAERGTKGVARGFVVATSQRRGTLSGVPRLSPVLAAALLLGCEARPPQIATTATPSSGPANTPAVSSPRPAPADAPPAGAPPADAPPADTPPATALIPTATPAPATPSPFDEPAMSTFDGVATWYEVPEGSLPERRAPGEWTAAYDRLPLGTYARVTNKSNGRVVIVCITDKGVGRHAIDLCKEAAAEIGLVGKGETKVKIEVLRERKDVRSR